MRGELSDRVVWLVPRDIDPDGVMFHQPCENAVKAVRNTAFRLTSIGGVAYRGAQLSIGVEIGRGDEEEQVMNGQRTVVALVMLSDDIEHQLSQSLCR